MVCERAQQYWMAWEILTRASGLLFVTLSRCFRTVQYVISRDFYLKKKKKKIYINIYNSNVMLEQCFACLAALYRKPAIIRNRVTSIKPVFVS